MMTVAMDRDGLPASSRDLAQKLYKKNIELENGLRKSAQSRTPSDPNVWPQIRENYEAIILKDHDFSEKHGIECILWQLHHRRIEEFRARINAASAISVTSQSEKNHSRPDNLKKIRSVFKSFLSEATGFYHDLIMKIRAKYGLPLGFFSDGLEGQTILAKDEKKSSEMKKGLFWCHRCLIYLGDLARYKGLFGEGESVSRDYAAASSYYIQAASLWPSSGNPHHQLGLLASYSGDELGAVYHYFRSYLVDTPFSKAKDNLILAFEKNRHTCSQLPGNAQVTSARILPALSTGSGRGRGDIKHQVKGSKLEGNPTNEHDLSIPEILKAFYSRFVRISGILFTGLSLETFDETLSSVIRDLHKLLSSGSEEELNFGQDAAASGLVLVRLVTILISTVHNVKKDLDGQTYAEILQRTMLLQNAITSAFQFAGHIVERCTQLNDASSSYLLPAILIFIEWLACHPDITAGSDHEEKQSSAISFFWNQFVSFLNILVESGLVSSVGNEDDNCFVDMGRYDEGETCNRVALWEDFELRGFLPLVAAHVILDFSRKYSFGGDGNMMEKKARLQRIFAAGRTLIDVVRIDQQGIYFDQNKKKIVIGVKPVSSDDHVYTSLPQALEIGSKMSEEGYLVGSTVDLGVSQPCTIKMDVEVSEVNFYSEGEEEEEIVFKPMVNEKYPNLNESTSTAEIIQPVQNSSAGDLVTYTAPLSAPFNYSQMPTLANSSSQLLARAPNVSQQSLSMYTSKWPVDEDLILSHRINSLNLGGNGLQNGFNNFQPVECLPPVYAPGNQNIGVSYSEMKVGEPIIPSKLDSVMQFGAMTFDCPNMRHSAALPVVSRKNPVSRPVRHNGPPPGFGHFNGPPPGFGHFPSKPLDDLNSNTRKDQYCQIDDYRWQDGYQSLATNGMGMNSRNYAVVHVNTSNNALMGATAFPFPGKQVFTSQTRLIEKPQDSQFFEQFKLSSDEQLQQANLQAYLLEEQRRAQQRSQYPWSSRGV